MEQRQFIKRDISWLSFNHRVLQEAKDPTVPLYERIKFLAIYSSNLDEFYRVRVATLRQFRQMDKSKRKALLEVKPKKELKAIRTIVQQQQSEFGSIFRHQILPALRREGIDLLHHTREYTPQQQAFAKTVFAERLKQNISLHPLAEGADLPFLKNRSLYLLLTFPDTDDLALVNVPSDEHDRFWILPASDERLAIGFLDDLIRLGLPDVLPVPHTGAYALKLSRDADLYLGDEYDGDLVEKIKNSLGQRDTGTPTRLLYDSHMPPELVLRLKRLFQLKKTDLSPGARYHNFHDFFQLPAPEGKPHLHNLPWPPLSHPQLEGACSILTALRQKDQLLHFPYQKYDYVPRLIREAARDEEVTTIKITLYRVAGKSAVVDGLLEARRQGKEVVVFIEAKARFDEASNLYWGQALEEAGATVLYSYPDIKVHTKLLLITRREEHKPYYYAYLGTGNFNEKTARLYGDHALLTADQRIAGEVEKIFGLLQRRLVVPKTEHLLVSPFDSRRGFEAMIDREIALARQGQKAYIIAKMNSLEDQRMIEKLYEASQAGVRIRLIVRGICCLVPGIPGLSEYITVTSIVDRYLEHARIYIFGNGGQESMHLASADWMERNLDRRIECIFPIYDPDLFQELRDIITLQLRDNVKARQINAAQSNPYQPRSPEEVPQRAQEAIYQFLATKVAATQPAPSPIPERDNTDLTET